MALNCSMITPTNEPVRLPGEKIFISVKAVTIHLNPTTPGAGTTSETPLSPTSAIPVSAEDPKQKGKLSLSGILSAIALSPPDDGSAHGTVYVTNQRILFIADDAASQPDPPPHPSPPPAHPNQPDHQHPSRLLPKINTLTVPLRNSFDGRFVQPWLSANYHLSTFVPVPNGNLPPPPSTATAPHAALDSFTLKIIFNEGHGFEFTEALEEVKRIMFQSDSQRPAELEELPTYSPPMSLSVPLAGEGGPSSSLQPGDSSAMTGTEAADALPPPIDDFGPGARRDTLPEADLMLAASIASHQEHHEQMPITHLPPNPEITDLAPPDLPVVPPPPSDAPPGYEP
ncbi:hypothetical protein PtA15_5A676 [Puccinia triticina]|uniref:GRAM domain-containing protein n=1 Tax=Puccinia triticina TaxID=208348 RepID=A0ABY7CKW4_9BASI|nr:uncharacterized protein PtA15_5A676 [Puccinia triticina]WAQ85102.1 hypothetical protein PtA15_5A676 [Puccinia triticina]WAR58436.1 hypothetical protein PtB15_5B670 [Puccinia triticina]